MKKLFTTTIALLFIITASQAQSIDDALKKYNKNSVDYITVNDLNENYENFIILDTRKKEEFDISHLPGAIFVGDKQDYNTFLATQPDKSKPIVVYCSIGVRSEDCGETMSNENFTNVKNLYGGIFMWKDAGFKIVDNENKPTQTVHVYSKEWAQYLKTGKKVY